ncbi:Bone morphogenetic protein 1 [Bulinus truncatus]|nr:Bone morphogenetic protein 1 [Bulinus truncatus]
MMNLENSVFGLIVMATLQLGITALAPGEASQATDRRHLKEDFTLINRNVCPPSLCRNNDEPTRNASKVKARSLFYQGDIVLSQKLKEKVFSSERSLRHRRAATRDKKMLWKDGLVIYNFNENIDSRSRVALMEAMSHISNNTCITFREKTSRDQHYVIFQSEPGCWAGIGVAEAGHQLVNLGEGCDTVGIAIHEIMHALGFWHEQARPDRDAYVTIIRENIAEENLPTLRR